MTLKGALGMKGGDELSLEDIVQNKFTVFPYRGFRFAYNSFSISDVSLRAEFNFSPFIFCDSP